MEKNKITLIKDGPIIIEGELEIKDQMGLIIETTGENPKTFLCRCGGSNRKPFCDGTHKKIEFKG
jgi:CDGSH-type Zn-finger protein